MDIELNPISSNRNDKGLTCFVLSIQWSKPALYLAPCEERIVISISQLNIIHRALNLFDRLT